MEYTHSWVTPRAIDIGFCCRRFRCSGAQGLAGLAPHSCGQLAALEAELRHGSLPRQAMLPLQLPRAALFRDLAWNQQHRCRKHRALICAAQDLAFSLTLFPSFSPCHSLAVIHLKYLCLSYLWLGPFPFFIFHHFSFPIEACLQQGRRVALCGRRRGPVASSFPETRQLCARG